MSDCGYQWRLGVFLLEAKVTLRWSPRSAHLVFTVEYTVSSWGFSWTGGQPGVPGEVGLERAMEAYTMLLSCGGGDRALDSSSAAEAP